MSEIRPASERDEAGIVELLGQQTLGSRLQVRFDYRPAFSRRLASIAGSHTVLVGDDQGRISAVAACSHQEVIVKGAVRCAGYLHSLRVSPSHRGTLLLARLLRELAAIERADPCDFYYASVDRNSPSLPLFCEGRMGLPLARAALNLHTFAVPRQRLPVSADPAVTDIDRVQHEQILFGIKPPNLFVPAFAGEPRPEGIFKAAAFGRTAGTWEIVRDTGRSIRIVQMPAAIRFLSGALALLRKDRRRSLLNSELRLAYLHRFVTDREADRPLLLKRALAFSEPAADYVVVALAEHDPLCRTAAALTWLRYDTTLIFFSSGSETCSWPAQGDGEFWLDAGRL